MSSVLLPLLAARLDGSTSEAILGNTITGVQVGAAVFGGYFTFPLILPLQFDRTRDAFLRITLFKGTGLAPLVPLDVVIKTNATIVDPGFGILEVNATDVITIPGSWGTGSWLTFTANGGSPLFAAHTLEANSILGFRVDRDGAAAADTYTLGIAILRSVDLEFNRLCSYGDCP